MRYDIGYAGHWKKLPPPMGTKMYVQIGSFFLDDFDSEKDILFFLYGERFFLENEKKWRVYDLDFSSPVPAGNIPSNSFVGSYEEKERTWVDGFIDAVGEGKVKMWAKDFQPLYIRKVRARLQATNFLIAYLEKKLKLRQYPVIQTFLLEAAQERRWIFSQEIFSILKGENKTGGVR